MLTQELDHVCVKADKNGAQVEPVGDAVLVEISNPSRMTKDDVRTLLRHYERMRDLLLQGVSTCEANIRMFNQQLSTTSN